MIETRLIEVKACMRCCYLGACSDGLSHTKLNTEGISPHCNLKTIPGFLEDVFLDIPEKTIDRTRDYSYTYHLSMEETESKR